MNIIAVSDVHLGYMLKDKGQSLKDDFDSFLDNVLDRKDIDIFVICGDFLDMWRRDMSGVAIENADTLHKLQMLKSKMKVYYVAGNHDYHVLKLKGFKYPFEFSTEKILQDGSTKYVFKHGYDFDSLMKMNEIFFDPLCYSSDELGDIASEAYEIWINSKNLLEKISASIQKNKIISDLNNMLLPAEKRLTDEERNKIYLKAREFVKPGEVIIFGHTHEPFINKEENVVNLGSWVKDSKVNNTYLEIKNGKMALKIFPAGEITERKIL